MRPHRALLLAGALMVVLAPAAASCGTDEDVSAGATEKLLAMTG